MVGQLGLEDQYRRSSETGDGLVIIDFVRSSGGPGMQRRWELAPLSNTGHRRARVLLKRNQALARVRGASNVPTVPCPRAFQRRNL